MKMEWTPRRSDGRASLTAEPESYDAAPPISGLIMDRAPALIHDDVLSVAAILAFGSYCSGPIALPRRVSPEVAAQIERFCAPIWVNASPIEMLPRANSSGDGLLLLSDTLSDWANYSTWGESRQSILITVEASELAGSLVGYNGMILPTNEFAFSAGGSCEDRLAVKLAVGILFAESFFASRVAVPNQLLNQVSKDYLGRVSSLLESCKIGLVGYED